MIKKITTSLAAAIMVICMAIAAFAEGPVSGKVTNVGDEMITVTVAGTVPAWAKPGAVVMAGGGMPTVVSVKGNEVVLKFSKVRAATIKLDSSMTLTEGDDDLQGC
jgi:hypothetical protein